MESKRILLILLYAQLPLSWGKANTFLIELVGHYGVHWKFLDNWNTWFDRLIICLFLEIVSFCWLVSQLFSYIRFNLFWKILVLWDTWLERSIRHSFRAKCLSPINYLSFLLSKIWLEISVNWLYGWRILFVNWMYGGRLRLVHDVFHVLEGLLTSLVVQTLNRLKLIQLIWILARERLQILQIVMNFWGHRLQASLVNLFEYFLFTYCLQPKVLVMNRLVCLVCCIPFVQVRYLHGS